MSVINISRSVFKKQLHAPGNYASTAVTTYRRFMSTDQSKDTDKNENGIPLPEAPGWKEDLASTSEAFVKADRADSTSTEELQERTINYVRDEVSGPLKSAQGREENAEEKQRVTTVTEKMEKKVEEEVKGVDKTNDSLR